ncbi:MAG: SLC13 family permease [bacterium]
MSLEIVALLALLVVMAVLFLSEKLPLEVTAFSGLVILVLSGLVPVDQAFDGFRSPAVITMLSMFFLASALRHTGITDRIGHHAEARLGKSEVVLSLAVMLAAAALSAFMYNIAATAVLLPAVMSVAQRTGASPSRLFMPLSFGAILGGTVTLVGSPPNILVADAVERAGVAPLGLFDIAPVGLVLVLVGVAYMVLVGRRWLPQRDAPAPMSRRSDLVQVYRLHSSLFSIRVPRRSTLEGKALKDTSLSRSLGIRVVSVLRGGKPYSTPDAETTLLAGDILLVQGSADDVRSLFRVSGSEFAEAAADDIDAAGEAVSGIVARPRDGSAVVGKTLRELDFRRRFGGIVIGVGRDGGLSRSALGDVRLTAGDELLVIGVRRDLDEEGIRRHFVVAAMGATEFRKLRGQLFVVRVPGRSGLVGRTIAETRLGELVGLTISGILRGGDALLGLEPSEVIRKDDRLLVTGAVDRMRDVLELGQLELQQDVGVESLESERVGLVEVTLPPRSSAAGRTLADLRFRDRYGLQVLAIWREGRCVHDGLASLSLRFGDALLVQGAWRGIQLLAGDANFVVLSERAQGPRRTRKAPIALLALAGMVGMVLLGWQPLHVAAFTAATFVLLGGAVTMEEAYRGIEWRALFVVAAILPFGVALQQTGAADLLARQVVAVAGPLGPTAVLAALAILSSAVSQSLDGAPAVVLLAPVATAAATALGVSPTPLLLGVGFGASAAFLTPFSHKANLLVMGAGGYRTVDYLRVGALLTVVFVGIVVLLVPVLFPF